ncbi:46_t:CDS:1, partial [Funneliformis caledonium]
MSGQVNISSIEYIKQSELARIMKDTTQIPGKDYLVVDVRDDDYE